MTITCLLLGLAGCLAVFNATFHRAAPLAFVARQAVWLVAAAAVMLAAAGRGPKFWRRSLPFWAAGAYAALLLVLLCGERVNGMRGWFAWHGVFIQPSELAKPIFLLCLASRLEYRSEDLRNGKGYLSLLGLFGLCNGSFFDRSRTFLERFSRPGFRFHPRLLSTGTRSPRDDPAS